MKSRNLLSITDLAPDEIGLLVERGHQLKKESHPTPLAGRTVVLLFEKPSLRTRASFSVAIHQLGGASFYMDGHDVGLGLREPISDIARVLSSYVDCIVARTHSHATLVEMTQYAYVPVINALTDHEHPCQTLADLLTIYEAKGRLQGIQVAYIGDGNNVARSLALGIASVGGSFTIASPPGYGLDETTLATAHELGKNYGAHIRSVSNPSEALSGAQIIYTDVWTSMGQETEADVRRSAFKAYTIDEAALSKAQSGAIFMHPMPAHYGEEVAPGILDHPQSVAFDQAENRLHAQKAALEFLL